MHGTTVRQRNVATSVVIMWATWYVGLAGCGVPQRVPSPSAGPEIVADWRTDWNLYLGKRITIDGYAHDLKLGPLLSAERSFPATGAIWIDGLPGWPDGVGGATSAHVRVTGIVVKRDDMPVYLNGTHADNGAPGRWVDTEEELNRLKWRFLLKDATWTVID